MYSSQGREAVMTISAASENFEKLPLELQEFLRAQVELLLFDYTPEQWMEIAKSIQHFQEPDAYENALFKLRNSARSYFLATFNQPDTKRRKKLLLKHWTKTRDLADALMSEFFWLARDELNYGPPDHSGNERKPYHENRFALMKIRLMATANLISLGGKIDDGIQRFGPEAIALMKTTVVYADDPKTTAKSAYHSDVLDVWTELGGKLKISRHPNTGKLGGPLARYFSAVTLPVHGGSPESLPDIIERHVARKGRSRSGG
jgi:hypothetical protein